MTALRWILLALAALAVAATVAFSIFKRPIADAAFRRAIETNMLANTSSNLEDGIHVFLCGTGSPLPDPLRGGPCLAVLAGDHRLIFDAGSGSARTLAQMRFPMGEIDRIYLTHLHSDHIDGLGEVLLQSWINGVRTRPTPVAGPEGIVDVVEGFNRAYRPDSGFRTAHHGEAIAPPSGSGGVAERLETPETSDIVFDRDGLTVRAIQVNHDPVEPALGFRIDYAGRSVAISGDTTFDENFVAAAMGADLVVHEALQPDMVLVMKDAAENAGRDNIATILGDILDYHASPEDAARAAEKAGADMLVLTHIVPPLPTRLLHDVFLGDARDNFGGDLIIGEDGLLVSLPAGSEEINVKSLL